MSQDVLSKQDVLKAIRKHEAVEAIGGLNNEQIEAVIKASEAYCDAGYAVVIRHYDKKNKCPDEIIISWPEVMPEEPYKVIYGRG